MHPLQMGGDIIDTPGIKGFGLVNMEDTDLSHFFPEILPSARSANSIIVSILMNLSAP
jgi:ribosome biogenesis GTPase